MIFASVGTDNHDFSRLVKAMDELAKTHSVVMQTGHSSYRPKHARWFSFETNKTIDSLYRRADIIVTHAGAGSIIRSLSEGKIPIVVPRLKAFGEHINNHQLDLARALARRGRIVLVEDVAELGRALRKRRAVMRRNTKLVKKMSEILKEYEKKIS